MSSSELKHLKELEKENARLKKIVAEQALDIQMLKSCGEKSRSGFEKREQAGADHGDSFPQLS